MGVGEGHFIVEVELVGAHAGARLSDRAHVVIPARPLLRMIPVRRPAEVGGIDVCSESGFKSVQLVGSAEVHLAGEHGAITLRAQVMRIGGNIGGEFGGVVIDARMRGEQAGHERSARGRAEGAGAIGALEHHAAGGEGVDVGRLDDLVPIGRQKDGRESTMTMRMFGCSVVTSDSMRGVRTIWPRAAWSIPLLSRREPFRRTDPPASSS